MIFPVCVTHLDGCSKMRNRVPPLLSTPLDGAEPNHKSLRSRDCVHHYIPSIQHITWPTEDIQLIVAERMNKLRMANQSLLIVFLDSQKTQKIPSTPTDPPPLSSIPAGLGEGVGGQASQIIHFRVRDVENHPSQPIISIPPVPTSLMSQLESA